MLDNLEIWKLIERPCLCSTDVSLCNGHWAFDLLRTLKTIKMFGLCFNFGLPMLEVRLLHCSDHVISSKCLHLHSVLAFWWVIAYSIKYQAHGITFPFPVSMLGYISQQFRFTMVIHLPVKKYSVPHLIAIRFGNNQK